MFEVGFDVSRIYYSRNNCEDLYLYVLKTVCQYDTRRAVFGVMFDSSFRIVSKRWFRVAKRGKFFVAHGLNVVFLSADEISENHPCYPPNVVLEYFSQAPGGVCA